jgi:hypothetical protein
MSAGQCRIDPPTGIAGSIWSGWIGGSGNGLASGVIVSGSTLRNIVASQVEAIAAAVDSNASLDPHTQSRAWLAGTSSGNYVKGTAIPSGSIASGNVFGCDGGGTITVTTGLNTNTGPVFTVYFGVAYPVEPSPSIYAADTATAAFMFATPTYVTATTSGFSLNVNSAPPNATYKWKWLVNGCVS